MHLLFPACPLPSSVHYHQESTTIKSPRITRIKNGFHRFFFLVIPAKAGIQFFRSMGKMPTLPWLPRKQPRCSHAPRLLFPACPLPSRVHGLHGFSFDKKNPCNLESIAKLSGNVAQSPSAVFNLLYFQCFAHKLPSRGRLGYSFAIGSSSLKNPCNPWTAVFLFTDY